MPETKYVVFSYYPSPPDYFHQLHGFSSEIRRGLYEMLTDRLRLQADQLEPPEIAMHLRRGDFVVLMRQAEQAGKLEGFDFFVPSVSYYIEVLETLRALLGENTSATIFTDAFPHEISELLALPKVRLAKPQSDVLDLLQLSRARVLVMSPRSTFSYFAGFLSESHLIHHPRFRDGPIHDPSEKPGLFEGVLPDFATFLAGKGFPRWPKPA